MFPSATTDVCLRRSLARRQEPTPGTKDLMWEELVEIIVVFVWPSCCPGDRNNQSKSQKQVRDRAGAASLCHSSLEGNMRLFRINTCSSLLYGDQVQRLMAPEKGTPCRDVSSSCHTQMKAIYFSFICNRLKNSAVEWCFSA